MRRPLPAAIGALWLSAITAAFASGGHGGGQKDPERATIGNISVRQSLDAGRRKQDEYGWKKMGCHDELSKDLQAAPMWCKERQIGWGDPLYPFRSEISERDASPHLWWRRDNNDFQPES
jgi:hypothetical protein